ncbi:hypothetical protein [Polycladidibacter stylochi]|uniref:hypothetical protein n=1 Tax=Polycladidibacter stylochi TaxID=1807766 RepID=UPI0008358E35|nr:hypothetical protein [Pseudovibrio stylochi]
MTKVHIRYTVRPEDMQENNTLLKAFFDELEAVKPAGLTYEAYLIEDGVTFVHVVDSATNAAPFRDLRSYRRYRDTLQARCNEPPQMVTLKVIGSYRPAFESAS